jgi:hypothetical protein
VNVLSFTSIDIVETCFGNCSAAVSAYSGPLSSGTAIHVIWKLASTKSRLTLTSGSETLMPGQCLATFSSAGQSSIAIFRPIIISLVQSRILPFGTQFRRRHPLTMVSTRSPRKNTRRIGIQLYTQRQCLMYGVEIPSLCRYLPRA